jgi:hypothetical protein
LANASTTINRNSLISPLFWEMAAPSVVSSTPSISLFDGAWVENFAHVNEPEKRSQKAKK